MSTRQHNPNTWTTLLRSLQTKSRIFAFSVMRSLILQTWRLFVLMAASVARRNSTPRSISLLSPTMLFWRVLTNGAIVPAHASPSGANIVTFAHALPRNRISMLVCWTFSRITSTNIVAQSLIFVSHANKTTPRIIHNWEKNRLCQAHGLFCI